MKKIVLFIIITISTCQLMGQVYQRMAIPRGVYRLSAKGSAKSVKDVAAYCVDFSRAAPTKGVSYENLLEGMASVIFEGTNQIKTLQEAIKAGDISIEGTRWKSASAYIKAMNKRERETISNLMEIRKNQFMSELKSRPEYNELPPFKKLMIEREFAKEFTLRSFLEKNPEIWRGTGNWSQLRLVNNTNSNISIQAERNLQFGTKNEVNARKGLENFDFKLGSYGETEIQERAWIKQTKDDYLRLKTIGEYSGEIPTDDKVLSEAKATFKKFQEKYEIETTGELNPITNDKIHEIENKILEEFKILNENPSNVDNLGQVIEKYQLKYGLDVDKSFNASTREHLTNRKNNLKKDLESVIHGIEEKNLSESIDIYKKIKNTNNKATIADDDFLKVLKSDNNYYLSVDGNYKAFEKSNISIKNVDGEEIENLKTIRYDSQSNIHLNLKDHILSSIESFNKNLDWDYDIDEISIFPLTKNKDTRDLLKNRFGKNWIKSNLKSNKNVAKKLKKSKRKTILVVGHIENGYFVDGDFKISIEVLNNLAKKYKLNIFHLGCSTAQGFNAGTTASINTYKTVDALISSVQESSNFKNFLLNFSNKGISPDGLPINLLVDANTFSNKGFAQFKAYRDGGVVSAATLGGGILLYYLLSEEESENQQ